MIDKNILYQGEVIDYTVNGEGVVKVDTYPVFIKNAVIGDFIEFQITKTNKTYGFGKLLGVLKKGEFSIAPKCSEFYSCGGCSLMHTAYQKQLDFKENLVLSNIYKQTSYKKGDFVYDGIIACEDIFNYRNKAQFPVGEKKGKVVCGFYHQKSHDIVPLISCDIQDEKINKALLCVMDFINEEGFKAYNEKTHKGFIRHIYIRSSKDEMMICIVTNSTRKIDITQKLIDDLSKIIPSFSIIQNINTKKTNVVLGDKNITLYGKDHIMMNLGDLVFKISPHSFFQVNTNQTLNLYNKALEYADIKDTDTVFDLYSGVGSISLFVSKCAKKVIGVEIVNSAVKNAIENARINGIENCEFYLGDCGEVVEKLLSQGEKADVCIIDPPRKGASGELLNLLNEMNAKKIVYVSCNSSTLARDIEILNGFGYKLKKLCAVDMFAHTSHVEAVALLQQLSLPDATA